MCSGGFFSLKPLFQRIGAADVAAVDVDLREGIGASDRTQAVFRIVTVEHQFLELDTGVVQQSLRPGAVAATLAREEADVERLLRIGRDVFQHRVRIGDLEWIARFLRLDRLDDRHEPDSHRDGDQPRQLLALASSSRRRPLRWQCW